jgi:uncharacterized protein YqeY
MSLFLKLKRMKNISLKDRLKMDLKLSIKNGDTTRKNIIRFITSEIEAENMRRNRGNILNEEGMLSIVRKIKNALDSIPLEKKTQEILDEIKILNNYLPQLLSYNETEKIIDNIIDGCGNDFGKIMQKLNIEYKGKVDNKMASEIIKNKIN